MSFFGYSDLDKELTGKSYYESMVNSYTITSDNALKNLKNIDKISLKSLERKLKKEKNIGINRLKLKKVTLKINHLQ